MSAWKPGDSREGWGNISLWQRQSKSDKLADLLLGAGGCLDAVAALDDVRLQTDRTGTAM